MVLLNWVVVLLKWVVVLSISKDPPDGYYTTIIPQGLYRDTYPDCVFTKKFNSSYGVGNKLECNCQKMNPVTGAIELVNSTLNGCTKNNIIILFIKYMIISYIL